jgi:hypothetical protein
MNRETNTKPAANNGLAVESDTTALTEDGEMSPESGDAGTNPAC